MEGKVLSKPTIDDSGEVVLLVRELPPAHCILKVDSFSQIRSALSGIIKGHFQSTEFTSSGYKWVMHIYPTEQAYVSVYISMVDKLDIGSYVNVVLRLFIYDQIRDNYLTVQYIREKRFSTMKKSWGMPKFISVASLIDASNGFLLHDICFFGAEVLVLDEGHLQGPILSILSRGKVYTWRIKQFSELSGIEPANSPLFTFGKWSWKLSLFPKGRNEEKGKSLSAYLEVQNGDDLTKGSQLYAQYFLSVRHQSGGSNYQTAIKTSWFGSNSSSEVFEAFMPLEEFAIPKQCYLVNDVLIIDIIVKAMFLLKDIEQ